jgi:hypothetical protein
MRPRRLILLIATLLCVQFVIGCNPFNRRDESLPAGRNVKVVVFPVRHLKYSGVTCRQEYEDVNLSGTMTNSSPYKLTGVHIEALIFFAGETATRRVAIATAPSTLRPSDSATFEMNALVEDPVARIELHPAWDK